MCTSCTALRINGILCHELGCPDAYKDSVRECKECGCEFYPESNFDKFCSASCYASYNGIFEDELESDSELD